MQEPNEAPYSVWCLQLQDIFPIALPTGRGYKALTAALWQTYVCGHLGTS